MPNNPRRPFIEESSKIVSELGLHIATVEMTDQDLLAVQLASQAKNITATTATRYYLFELFGKEEI